jgi:ribonuclease HII
MVKNPPPEIFKLIRDSKKLTPSARSSALAFINANALFIASVMIPHKIIDQININRATGLALDRLLKLVPFIPDIVIMDGNMKFNPAVRYMPVKRGDSLSISIASASIAAKVERDRIMERMDGVFPGYGFASHKGYGTAEHISAIHRLGPCKIHRMSYEPLKSSFRAGQDITHEGN